ncbi:hypothetical protein YC2023_055268 [Brassica napus]
MKTRNRIPTWRRIFTYVAAKSNDAVVRLLCKNKNAISETKTCKNGYFLLYAPKTVTNYAINGCRAYLVKSPDAECSKVSKLHGGYLRSVLKPVAKPENSTVIFFTS